MDGAYLFTRTHRTVRPAEWTPAKAVTFTVTLAATRSVTLAARAAGMSRKAAYALRQRDSAFAAAWDAALAAGQGDEVHEVHDPPISPKRGNARRFAEDSLRRDRFFARLAYSSSPLVGEDRGGGCDASASHKTLSAADTAGPHPNPSPRGGGGTHLAQLVPTRPRA